MEHRKSETYSGKYLGVPYEIKHWYFSDGKPNWNYYIFLIENQIPDTFPSLWLKPRYSNIGGKSRAFYDYEKTIIANLEWHMGCTFYEKVSGFDKQTRMIKVGCDYAHLYDEGKNYLLSDIERDVIDCIESLISRVKVLQWCSYCGDYVEVVDERTRCSNCKDK